MGPHAHMWERELRCRFRRGLLSLEYLAFSFLSGMKDEDCSVYVYHRSILQRPRLRTITRVNPVRLRWGTGHVETQADVFQGRND